MIYSCDGLFIILENNEWHDEAFPTKQMGRTLPPPFYLGLRKEVWDCVSGERNVNGLSSLSLGFKTMSEHYVFYLSPMETAFSLCISFFVDYYSLVHLCFIRKISHYLIHFIRFLFTSLFPVLNKASAQPSTIQQYRIEHGIQSCKRKEKI